jgi:hypothetical protein
MTRSIPERDITTHEAAIVEWLLDHAAMRDVTPYRTTPITSLRVVGGCDCGCSSLDFHSNTNGSVTMLADAVAVYADQQKAGLILWGRANEIVWLEMVEMDPAVNHRVPDIADLRRYEDLFRERPSPRQRLQTDGCIGDMSKRQTGRKPIPRFAGSESIQRQKPQVFHEGFMTFHYGFRCSNN